MTQQPEHLADTSDRANMNEVITLEADRPFEVEIAGPLQADTAVIMVHGFGVRRDARGMFTDLEQAVKPTMLSVRGEFSDVRDDSSEAVPITLQAERLAAVVNYTKEHFGPSKLVFVGHSQGSLVVAKYLPSQSRVLLLAPPVEEPAERFAATPGWSRLGSHLDKEGESVLSRSDGSITRVSADYWQDFAGYDANSLYTQLADNNEVEIIFAGADQVLGQEAAPSGLPSISIAGADHDFRGDARQLLLAKVLSEISK